MIQLDLASFESIKNFSNTIHSKYHSIDVLINNAGVMGIINRELTVDGLEYQIGTNHFGHFLLTSLIFPLLAYNGRIINHSSSLEFLADFTDNFPFNNLQSEIKYDKWLAYGKSKRANLLFTYEINRRLSRSNPRNIISIAVHPGYTATNIQHCKFIGWEWDNKIFAMRPEDGSLAQIEAAVDQSIPASMHTMYGPKYGGFGAPVVSSVIGSIMNFAPVKMNITTYIKAQQFLWKESIQLTGASFSDI